MIAVRPLYPVCRQISHPVPLRNPAQSIPTLSRPRSRLDSGEISAESKRLLGIDKGGIDCAGFRKGAGCEICRHTGYSGRTAIMEILEVSDEVRGMIRDGTDDKKLEAAVRRAGAQPLMTSAVRHLLDGRTTLEEIFRVVPLAELK